jgi:putative ABC transport system ATP-binding protein
VARALVTEPAIVIGDEPTGNLDSKTTSDILNLITQVNRTTGATFIIVTHNQEVAEQTHRIISIRDGLVEKEQRLHRLDMFTGQLAPTIPLPNDREPKTSSKH